MSCNLGSNHCSPEMLHFSQRPHRLWTHWASYPLVTCRQYPGGIAAGRLSHSAEGLNLHFAIASVTSLWDCCQLSTATNLHLPLALFSSSSFPSLLLFFASASTSWSLCFPYLPSSCMTSAVRTWHTHLLHVKTHHGALKGADNL